MRPFTRLFAVVSVACIGACATNVPPNSNWDGIVYEGLDQDLRKLEVPETVDCHFYPLTNVKPNRRNKLVIAQFDCAEAAMAQGKPFKLGHTWIPVDSSLTEIIISQKNQFWVKKIDVMLDGSDATQETLLCDQVRFNTKTATVEIDGCSQQTID